MSQIRILHHLARTGGTLIAKCLGCMHGNVLLSEVHPNGMSVFDPVIQAREWFGLLTDADIQQLRQHGPLDFAEAILLIAKRCAERDKKLILRDWTHLDFTGVPFRAPGFQLTTADTLRKRSGVIQYASVRHPIDQWLSLSTRTVIQGRLDPGSFLHGYRRFAVECKRIGFIRFEDFTRDAEKAMQQLCTGLKLAYDGSFMANWTAYDRITGDAPGEQQSEEILAPERKPVAADLLEQFARDTNYQQSLELLGYHHPI